MVRSIPGHGEVDAGHWEVTTTVTAVLAVFAIEAKAVDLRTLALPDGHSQLGLGAVAPDLHRNLAAHRGLANKAHEMFPAHNGLATKFDDHIPFEEAAFSRGTILCHAADLDAARRPRS